jgi:WD40 repeat protein
VKAGAGADAVHVAAAAAIPDALAAAIPAQRSGDTPAEVQHPGRSLLNEPLVAGPTRRPSGRTLAIAGVVLAVVVAGVVWATSGSGGGQPTAAPKTSSPAGPAKQPTAASTAPSPSTGASSTGSASASAPPDGLAVVRTMAADTACGVPSQLSFNPNGTQLAGAGRSAGGAGSGIACVWSVGSGALAYKATGYRRILGVQFDPGNGDLAYATSGNAVPLLIGAVGAVGNSIRGSISSTTHMRAPLEAIAVAPDGRTVAVSYTDSGTIQYYDAVHPHWLADASGGVVGATGTLTYSPSGSRIAHAEASGVVVLSTSSPAGAWHGPGATAAAFLTDSELVTCSGSRISVYDVTSATSTPLRGASITGTCAGIAVHPATHQIAVSTIDHGVVLLTLPSTWK